MKNIIILLSLLIVFGLFYSCSEKSVDSYTQNEPYPKCYFDDFIHFDTIRYILVKNVLDGSYYQEPIITKEQSLGEPFTDHNGNGRYDEGIDLFIISNDSTNQDLDGNLRYTSSTEPWTPEIPFDDLNDNGEFDYFNFYEPGHPFCDINENGVYDSALDYNYTIEKFSRTFLGQSIELTKYFSNHYSFISDLGVKYRYPDIQYRYSSYRSPKYFFYDDGLYFSYYPYSFKIVDTGQILPCNNIPILNINFLLGKNIYKTIILNDTLTIYEDYYDNLVHLKFETYDALIRRSAFDFYFDKQLGLISYTLHLFDEKAHYFNTRYDSIPIPMTR